MGFSFGGDMLATGVSLEKTIAEETQTHTLLEKLGGFLTTGKEKLRVAGRTIRKNADLILLAGTYLLEVGGVTLGTSNMAQNPQHTINAVDARLAVYSIIGTLSFVFVPIYYARFTIGRPLFKI